MTANEGNERLQKITYKAELEVQVVVRADGTPAASEDEVWEYVAEALMSDAAGRFLNLNFEMDVD